MVILVDMDDTIEQLLKAWIRAINERYGRNAVYEDFKTWDVSAPYPGLTRDQVYDIILEPGFWKTVEPIPGAVEGMKALLDDGHEIYIVTATAYQSVAEKMTDLLFKYFPYLTWHQVIITHNKQLIRGDVLIDDGIHNLEGGDFVKILMTAPHNRSYDAEANGMIRVHSWPEIVEVVRGLQKS